MTIDLEKPKGQRITKLTIKCSGCKDGQFEKIDLTKDYPVVAASYILNGKDHYELLQKHARDRVEGT